jgi:hypothetical protein
LNKSREINAKSRNASEVIFFMNQFFGENSLINLLVGVRRFYFLQARSQKKKGLCEIGFAKLKIFIIYPFTDAAPFPIPHLQIP